MRGELGVAEAGEGAGDAGEDEREHDRRARRTAPPPAGEHEDAGADDGADAERHEVHRAERPLEAVVPGGFRLQRGDVFRRNKDGILLVGRCAGAGSVRSRRLPQRLASRSRCRTLCFRP